MNKDPSSLVISDLLIKTQLIATRLGEVRSLMTPVTGKNVEQE